VIDGESQNLSGSAVVGGVKELWARIGGARAASATTPACRNGAENTMAAAASGQKQRQDEQN
jgi:hypothetical protein